MQAREDRAQLSNAAHKLADDAIAFGAKVANPGCQIVDFLMGHTSTFGRLP
jgi:hypothetical protein